MVGERDYSQLTSLERKAGLIHLFQLMPKGRRTVSEWWGPASEISEDSNEDVVLAGRLRSLLSFSYLTPSLQVYVTRLFRVNVRIGIGRDVSRNELYQLLEVDKDRLGIFEEDGAREISRKVINHELKKSLRLYGELSPYVERELEHLGVESSETELIKYADLSFDKDLIRARQEFVEKYGEEP